MTSSEPLIARRELSDDVITAARGAACAGNCHKKLRWRSSYVTKLSISLARARVCVCQWHNESACSPMTMQFYNLRWLSFDAKVLMCGITLPSCLLASDINQEPYSN